MPDHDQTTDDQTTEEEEEQETFPIYSLESQTPDFDMKNLQFSYGTYVMPMFEWVKKVQTGEKAYDQKDPMDEEMMDRYEKYIDEYGQPEGMMSPSELISAGASALGTTIGAVKLVTPSKKPNMPGSGARQNISTMNNSYDPLSNKEILGISEKILKKNFNLGEEGYDIARDEGRVKPSKDKKDGTSYPPSEEMKRTQKKNKGPSAYERVKKKYGKAVMDVDKKKKEKK